MTSLSTRSPASSSRGALSFTRPEMAVHAHHQYLAHAFSPHDSRAIRPELDNDASALLGGRLPTAAAAARQAVDGSLPALDDLTCNGNNHYGCGGGGGGGGGGSFLPRKRARVGDVAGAGVIMEGHGALLPPLPAQQQQAFFSPAGDVQQSRAFFASAGDVQLSRGTLGSGAACTSGRPSSAAPVSSHSHGLHPSLLHRHGVEIDALVRIENERLRAGLHAARRRHLRAAVSALERAAARRLRGAEAEMERAVLRNAELEETLRQTSAEVQAWQGVARSHEAVAAGLRATLDQLLRSPSPCAGAGEEAEDEHSCCFEREGGADDDDAMARACKSCGEADACVLLLPCRHLCLCAGCEAAVDACPVCAATRNASLHVLLF